MAHYQFRYGDGQVDLNLEEGNVLSVLHGHPFPAIEDIRSATDRKPPEQLSSLF